MLSATEAMSENVIFWPVRAAREVRELETLKTGMRFAPVIYLEIFIQARRFRYAILDIIE
jgi:hypothetical protein